MSAASSCSSSTSPLAPVRVAFSGAKGSGKTTVVAHLHGQKAQWHSFAKPLKDLVRDLFQLWTRDVEKDKE